MYALLKNRLSKSHLIVMFYEVRNGMPGMLRFVISRILCILWGRCEEDKIRAIMGMCKELYLLKEHPCFLKAGPFDVAVSLRPNRLGGYTLTRVGTKLRCLYTSDCGVDRTLFLDTEIAKGTFRWTVKIEYTRKVGVNSFFNCGIAPSDVVIRGWCNNGSLGSVEQTCSFSFGTNEGCSMVSVSNNDFRDEEKHLVPDFSLVTMEVSVDERSLSLFVNERRFPCVIGSIPVRLYLGISACNHAAFTMESFRRLCSPTPCLAGECKRYWFRK